MPLTFDDVDFRADKPDLPGRLPVVSYAPPCLRDRPKTVEQLGRALDLDLRTTVDLPFGYGMAGKSGQVEVFSASGAVRARNVDRINRWDDERRPWAELERADTPDGPEFVLGRKTQRRLLELTDALLERTGLALEPAAVDVVLDQWAALDEKGNELDAGAGRATVRRRYAVEGLPLLGAGAKTQLHLDPDEEGIGGLPVRFFHVHRGEITGTAAVPLLGLEKALQPVLDATWSGAVVQPGKARLVITQAEVGLLTLPADVPQRFSIPTLRVEGILDGALFADDSQLPLCFGQYLPLVDAQTLEESGFATPTLHAA